MLSRGTFIKGTHGTHAYRIILRTRLEKDEGDKLRLHTKYKEACEGVNTMSIDEQKGNRGATFATVQLETNVKKEKVTKKS